MQLLESRFTSPSQTNTSTQAAMTTTTTTTTPLPKQQGASSPSASHHSFSFDAPISALGNNSNHSSISRILDGSFVRKKRSPRKPSLLLVNQAAERHMQRVLAASPLMVVADHQTKSNISALGSPAISNTGLSNQTLLTSHIQHQAASQKVVAESPPTLVSPALQPGMPLPHKPRATRASAAVGSVCWTPLSV
ncbi:MAG: hypothetical protein AAGJ35_13115 [Myxococcota bacterium]